MITDRTRGRWWLVGLAGALWINAPLAAQTVGLPRPLDRFFQIHTDTPTRPIGLNSSVVSADKLQRTKQRGEPESASKGVTASLESDSLFGRFDRNRDGKLQAEEIVEARWQLQASLHGEQGEAVVAAIPSHASLAVERGQWHRRFDLNGDGQLSGAECCKVLAKLLQMWKGK